MVAGFDLSMTVFAAALIFARFGAIFMLMPGTGESSIPAQLKLAFALSFAVAVGPVVAQALPGQPDSLIMALGLVATEALIGVMIGATSRILLSAAAVGGQIIGYQTGLAMAQSFDPTQGQSGALPAQFLNLLFITLIFVTNIHHYLIIVAFDSYQLMPTGSPPAWSDAAQWAVGLFSDTFLLAIQISAPVIAFGIIFYLGLGVLSRLMPQAQIFFIAMPLNILLGFSILAIAIGSISMVFISRYERFALTLS